MKLERSKNTFRNVIFGSITKIYNLLVPFLMRTAIIYLLGMEYAGLSSLFTSILTVLNLAELGVGSALVFSMYEPLANDDTEKICALMRLYKIYYRVIGFAVLIIGAALTPFLPYLIKRDLPSDINLYVLYYMNLFVTVLSYWLFAYKNCLLNVHQRNDISDKIGYGVNTVNYILQFLVLLVFKNYYAYVMVTMAFTVINNIVTALVVDRLYPQYKAKGKLSKEETDTINRRVRDLFTSKIGFIISSASDTVVISAFMGLSQLAVYQNYYFIMNAVMGFITVITASSRSGIGNSIVTESKEKNYNDLKKFSFLFAWIGIFCTCCFACLYQPFIQLWVGKKNMLPYGMVITFCVYFFISVMQTVLFAYKDASGIWHQDRFRPLITSLTNLCLNLLMVNSFGFYGILISTIASVVIVGMPWLIKNLFSTVFCRSPKQYVESLLKYSLLALSLSAVCVFAVHYVIFDSLILTLILRAIICIIIPNTALFVIYRKSPEFSSLIKMLIPIISKLLNPFGERLKNGVVKIMNRLC